MTLRLRSHKTRLFKIEQIHWTLAFQAITLEFYQTIPFRRKRLSCRCVRNCGVSDTKGFPQIGAPNGFNDLIYFSHKFELLTYCESVNFTKGDFTHFVSFAMMPT